MTIELGYRRTFGSRTPKNKRREALSEVLTPSVRLHFRREMKMLGAYWHRLESKS